MVLVLISTNKFSLMILLKIFSFLFFILMLSTCLPGNVYADASMNFKVTDISGANFEAVFTGGDFDDQVNLYETLGDAVYKDRWITFIKTVFGWSIFEPSIQIDINHAQKVMKVDYYVPNIVKLNGPWQTINIRELREQGYTVSQEGNCFTFQLPVYEGLYIEGPIPIRIYVPSSAAYATFNQQTGEIRYITAVPMPTMSIFLGIMLGIFIITIFRKSYR